MVVTKHKLEFTRSAPGIHVLSKCTGLQGTSRHLTRVTIENTGATGLLHRLLRDIPYLTEVKKE